MVVGVVLLTGLPRAVSGACDACATFTAGSAWGYAGASALTEVSGIAAGRRNLDVLWVHNDGSRDRIYSLSTNGTLLGTWKLNKNVEDLEDIAIGPGPTAGMSYLYVGDIGGNVGTNTTRNEIHIIRVPEPVVSLDWATNPAVADLDDVEKFTVTYPDGSYDAETLMVDPLSGEVLVVIKQPVYSRVYRVLLPATSPGTNIPMTHLCNVLFAKASGGDISADGRQIVLRDETQALLWKRCTNESVGVALSRDGVAIPIVGPPAEPNGEGISFLCDGSGYVTTGEGVGPGIFFCAALCPAVPRFMVQPADQSAFVGGAATFTARAYGFPAPSWQWRFAGQNLAGQTTSTLALSNLTLAQAGAYQVVVSNASGSATNQATLAVRAKPDLRITEVLSNPTGGSGKADWWELTSFESQPVSLAGWRFNDNSGGLADPFVLPAGLSIAPGESIVLTEGVTAAQFRTWWGATNLPGNLQIISYSGSGLGLGAAGDGLRLWTDTATSAADTVASVDFGTSLEGFSFGYDFSTGVFGTPSVAGVAGAFRCVTSTDVGSPGYTRARPVAPMLRARRAGTKLRLEFPAEAQRLYQLQARAALTGAQWSPTGDWLRTTNAQGAAFEVVAPDLQRFFRVIVE